MFNGKMKAVTFSYDDGCVQDRRMVEIFNKYNLKCTFNLNSERLGEAGTLDCGGITVDHSRIKAEDLRHVYAGHEVAAHTLTHPYVRHCEDPEILRQVEQDRLNLTELMGYEVVGFAYPGGGENNDDHIAQLIRENTGVLYARGVGGTGSFDLPANLYRITPSMNQQNPLENVMALVEKFLALEPTTPQLLFLYGHSYSLDAGDRWDEFEAVCARISNHDDIFYGTNKEVLLG